jgi:hypothetical protein
VPHFGEMPPADMNHRRGMNDEPRAIDGALHGGLIVESGRDGFNREGRERAVAQTLTG